MNMPQVGGLQGSMFSYTGIPGMGGGYAYPPGSSMTLFLDGLNQTTAHASQIGKVNGNGNTGGMGLPGGLPQQGGQADLSQMVGMLFSMLQSIMQQMQGTGK